MTPTYCIASDYNLELRLSRGSPLSALGKKLVFDSKLGYDKDVY